jgi:hypothetical protein
MSRPAAPPLPPRTLTSFARDLAQGRPIAPFFGRLVEKPRAEAGPSEKAIYLSRVVRIATVESLGRSGGYRKRLVAVPLQKDSARGDRKEVERLWHPKVWEHLNLSFGPASIRTLINAYRFMAEQRAELRLPGPAECTWTFGDQVFANRVLESILRDADDWQSFFDFDHNVSLNASSNAGPSPRLPWLRLGRPDLGPLSPADLPELLAPGPLIVLTYIAPKLASQWLRAERRRQSSRPELGLQLYQRFASSLTLWTEAALSAGRADALLLIAEYLRQLASAYNGIENYGALLRRHVTDTIEAASSREAFLRAVGQILLLGSQLDEAFDDIVGRPFIDRCAADQVFQAGYHRLYKPISANTRAVGRALVGDIG